MKNWEKAVIAVPGAAERVAEIQNELRLKQNGRFSLGDVYVSERGHKVTVVALGENNATFAFTRTVKGVVEDRQRTVPFDLMEFFLKAYHISVSKDQ